jgi:hypothetical protein
MDLGNIAARELHHGRTPLVSLIGTDKNRNTSCRSFGESAREVSHFISSHFSSVWIREMAIRNEHRHLSEFRADLDSTKDLGRASDFDASRMRIVGYNSSVRESNEAASESVRCI